MKRRIPIHAARAGDYARFRSGPRKIVSAQHGGIAVVMIRPGIIGGSGWARQRRPDGKRTTFYTRYDLAHMGVRWATRVA